MFPGTSDPAEIPSKGPHTWVTGKHCRGSLPHVKREGATYFVTFRLDDTLPHEVWQELQMNREQALRLAKAQGRPLTWREQKNLIQQYTEEVDRHLNASYGHCWLRRPEIAGLVAEALRHFDEQRYTLAAWVVMPTTRMS